MELKDATGIQIPGQGFVAETIQFWQYGLQLGNTVPSRSVLLEGQFRLTIGGRSSVVTLGEDLQALTSQLSLLPSFLGLKVGHIKIYANGLLEIDLGCGRIETYDASWEMSGFCTPRAGYANFLEGGSAMLEDYGHLLKEEPEWRFF